MTNNLVQRRLSNLAFILISILLTGTLGYKILEDYSWLDALYMTVITITTTGFGELQELSDAGRLFTILLLMISLGFVTYTISEMATLIMDGRLIHFYREHTNKKKIEKLKNHTLICGFGRNGRQAAVKLFSSEEKFVIIDNNEEKLRLKDLSHLNNPIIITGDATHDSILIKAGIHNAKALIACLPDDANNLYIVLSARQLNPNLKIVSRASNKGSVSKLKIAGADHVIMPDKIGGEHMATIISMPSVLEFLDTLSVEGSYRNNMIEVDGNDFKPDYLGKSISEIDIRKFSGVLVIGHKNKSNTYTVNPEGTTQINQYEKYILLGQPNQIETFKHTYLKK